jgi:hypothetical protein
MENKNKKNKKEEMGESSVMQPILFTSGQYREMVKAFNTYSVLLRNVITPKSEIIKLFAYAISQSEKFGFEKLKEMESDWFEKIGNESNEIIYEYEQDNMWRNMAVLFARKDALKEIQEKTGLPREKLPEDMPLEKMDERIAVYLKEFAENGIQNIICKLK